MVIAQCPWGTGSQTHCEYHSPQVLSQIAQLAPCVRGPTPQMQPALDYVVLWYMLHGKPVYL